MTDFDDELEKYNEAANQMNQAIHNTIQQLSEMLQPILETITKTIIEFCNNLKPIIDYAVVGFAKYCKNYKNRRVVHLAFHAKKHRIREKNLSRLFNDYVKEFP